MSIWAMLGAAAARGRRVPRLGWATLTSKIGPVGFYKGRGVKATGKHTRKGAYQVLPERRPRYIVPDLSACELKPYVAMDPAFKGKGV